MLILDYCNLSFKMILEEIEKKIRVQEEKIGKFNLLLIGAVSFIVIFSISQFLQEKIIEFGLKNNLKKYSLNESVFVDQNSSTLEQKGTPREPFREISRALIHQEKNPEIKNIYINPGKYQGNFQIPENVNLYANKPGTMIIENSLDEKTLELKGNNIISGLEIQGGEYGIYIGSEAKNIKIENCKITQASSYGIYNKEHPETNDEYKLEIINSEVNKNYNHGLYLQKGTLIMKNSKIYENSLNGIDLHINMKVVITDSEIFDNVKSGIEADLGNLDLTIKNSTLRNNNLNGINLQSDFENSILKIENNLFENNRNAGINCIKKSTITPLYFSNSFETNPLENNQFQDNNTNVGPNCL